ncbi:MAG: hypothetical protein H7210_14610 [Pyrinomonadaceae bacterium]|nr:hypothetical protein [Phycisphaerales bacterium]
MTLETIRNAHQARPFSTFILHLVDGRQIKVTHPETLAIPLGEKGRTIVFYPKEGDFRFIDLLHVVELQLLNQRTRRRSA